MVRASGSGHPPVWVKSPTVIRAEAEDLPNRSGAWEEKDWKAGEKKVRKRHVDEPMGTAWSVDFFISHVSAHQTASTMEEA